MEHIIDQRFYKEDLTTIITTSFVPWDKLQDSSLLISGATGMIGSCLIDAIMFRNREYGLDCKVFALSRNGEKARSRFAGWLGSSLLQILEGDVNQDINSLLPEKVDFVLHLASNTHPVAYASDPIGTILTNIVGTRNMLEAAASLGARRFLFASSNEIYGENRGDKELFDESYLGYIDCNSLRAGYPESKRCGEALCHAYLRQKGLDIVIARLTRSFGPSLLPSDTKAMSQFLRNGAAKQDIVLKSKGDQVFSYTYAADAVSGLLTVLLKGEKGEAYNVAEESFDIPLKEIAGIIAEEAGTKVVFDLPDEVEAAGFSKATKARLDGSKLRALGWRAQYSLREGISRTLRCLNP